MKGDQKSERTMKILDYLQEDIPLSAEEKKKKEAEAEAEDEEETEEEKRKKREKLEQEYTSEVPRYQASKKPAKPAPGSFV